MRDPGRGRLLRRGLGALAVGSLLALVAGTSLARCDKNGAPPARVSKAAGKAAIAWQAPIVVATGDAYAGPWRMNESEFHYVDDGSVAVDEAGAIGVVWVDNRQKDVFFRRYARDNAAASAPVNVSRSPGIFSWLPRIVPGPSGRVFVLWQEIVFSGGSHGGDIFFAGSADAGQHFDVPVNLSNSAAGDGKGQITPDRWHNGSLDLLRGARGTLLAAWTSYEGRLFVSHSSDDGKMWSAPEHVAGDLTEPARGPALAEAPDGKLYLAWTVGRDPSTNIRVASSTDDGRRFGAAEQVADGAGYSDAPKIGVDARGVVHLAYAESPRGFFGPFRVRYTRKLPGTGFETPRVIAPPGASFPSLALDHAGNLYLAWEHHPDPAGPAFGLGFANSSDGGDTFSAPAVIAGTAARELGVNGSRQGKLARKLAVNAAGVVAVVDSRFQEAERSVVRLIRGL